MGWSFKHRPSYEKLTTFVERHLKEDTDCEVLAVSAKGNAAYAAVKDKNGIVSAIVILTQSNNTELHNQGYKYVHEELGPYHTECPKYILKMLSPTEDKYALAWRKACEYGKNPDYTAVHNA